MKRSIQLSFYYIFALLLIQGCDIAKMQYNPQLVLLAEDDYLTTEVNQPMRLDILANDQVAAESDIRLLNSPKHGQIKVANGKMEWIYEPHTNFSGHDTISYEITSNGETSHATVFILIEDPAGLYSVVANLDTVTVLPHTTKAIDLLVNDQLWGLGVALEVIRLPIHAEVSLDGSKLIYQPHTGIKEVYDTIGYRITSSSINHASSELIVQVNGDCNTYFKCLSDTIRLYGASSFQKGAEAFVQNDLTCQGHGFDYTTCQVKEWPLVGDLEYESNYFRFSYQVFESLRPYTTTFTYEICNTQGVCSAAQVVIITD